MPYLAGDDDGTCGKYTIEIPGDASATDAFAGALLELTRPRNWEQTGTRSPEAVAEAFRDAIANAVWAVCEGVGGDELRVAHIRDQKSQGTPGGTFTAGDWRVRTLNTIMRNDDIIVSLSGDQFQLIAGEFLLLAVCPANRVEWHQCRLVNYTAGSEVRVGSSAQARNGYGDQSLSVLFAAFTVAAGQWMEIQHKCDYSRATDGLGVAADQNDEVFTDVIIIEVA